ncbi:MAG: fatty acyl-AMP ligase [Mycobacterium sp.]|jgi:acyl-CoA synthetase (AMP-forming)/AMP-acid ligase II|nr:MAG: fatty acyl-AMP ligase [Mycobacterium sp.]
MSTAHTLVELLRRQAERYGDKVAFTFSYNGNGEEETRLTFSELDIKARSIAVNLQRQGAAGQRVLVFCRPGLDAITGFFGCLYAGAVAVPVHERLAPRLSSVIPDAQADFAVAPPAMPVKVKAFVETVMGLISDRPMQWCGTDVPVADADGWVPPEVDGNTTAMVQYTSGSTTAPNGVVVSHANLMHNLGAIRESWPGDDQQVAVLWLPPHHDMGLIGGVLQTIYLGYTTALMSPAAFMKRPMAWLEAISRNAGTYTVAPNFAFEICVQRSTPAERAALDLSALAVVMNGAEPVRIETMRAFAEAFAPAGFRLESFWPVYGLAEATLLVSGGSDSPLPVVQHVDRGALESDRVIDGAPDSPTTVALVSCGEVRGGQQLAIVDPETHRRSGADQIGEIWVAGPSVARGYLGNPQKTARTFAAYISGTGEGPFLRTGDLGFVRDGELYIAGRCKDLIVIDGANYYPNDIEVTVQGCHSALQAGRGAVFAITREPDAAPQLVITQEVACDRVTEAELNEIVGAVLGAVTAHHRVSVESFILLPAKQIPVTSSGKVQRGRCRQQYLDRELEAVAEWHGPARRAGVGNSAEFIQDVLARPRLGPATSW